MPCCQNSSTDGTLSGAASRRPRFCPPPTAHPLCAAGKGTHLARRQQFDPVAQRAERAGRVVMSPIHTRFSASGVKLRESTLSVIGIECLKSVAACSAACAGARDGLGASRIELDARRTLDSVVQRLLDQAQ